MFKFVRRCNCAAFKSVDKYINCFGNFVFNNVSVLRVFFQLYSSRAAAAASSDERVQPASPKKNPLGTNIFGNIFAKRQPSSK